MVPLGKSGLARLGIVRPRLAQPRRCRRQRGPGGGHGLLELPFDTIAHAFAICEEQRLGPSMAIYEPGFLQTVVGWWRAGRLPQGAMVKLYFSSRRGYMGAPFGLPPTETALDAYAIEVLGECDVPWAVSLVGGDVIASEGRELGHPKRRSPPRRPHRSSSPGIVSPATPSWSARRGGPVSTARTRPGDARRSGCHPQAASRSADVA